MSEKGKDVITIWDCRHREKMIVERVWGDLCISFQKEDGTIVFGSWYQLKKPVPKNFEKIVKYFKGVQSCLERQNEPVSP